MAMAHIQLTSVKW